jgi:hypothetical protein
MKFGTVPKWSINQFVLCSKTIVKNGVQNEMPFFSSKAKILTQAATHDINMPP